MLISPCSPTLYCNKTTDIGLSVKSAVHARINGDIRHGKQQKIGQKVLHAADMWCIESFSFIL